MNFLPYRKHCFFAKTVCPENETEQVNTESAVSKELLRGTTTVLLQGYALAKETHVLADFLRADPDQCACQASTECWHVH
jgi:hypothetical protein